MGATRAGLVRTTGRPVGTGAGQGADILVQGVTGWGRIGTLAPQQDSTTDRFFPARSFESMALSPDAQAALCEHGGAARKGSRID